MNKSTNQHIPYYCHSILNCVDCQIMHMKDIAETLGLPVSGAMCFGLAEGYDFSYWLDHSSKIPCLIMLGRTQEVVYAFLNKIGAEYNVSQVESKIDFKEYIKTLVNKEHIPLVYSDRYYLRYLEQKYNRAHFGNHMIAITGYRDLDNETEYAVCDVTSNEEIWCHADDIQLARSSTWKPFAPDCKVIDVNLNDVDISTLKNNFSDVIVNSIKCVTNKMLTSTHSGVYAMNALSSEISYLLNSDLKRYERAVSFQMRLIASFIKEFEETHSFYRMTYADFLSEAAVCDGLQLLLPFSERMRIIAEQWISISNLVSSKTEIPILIRLFSDQLKKIANLEVAFFEDLNRVLL